MRRPTIRAFALFVFTSLLLATAGPLTQAGAETPEPAPSQSSATTDLCTVADGHAAQPDPTCALVVDNLPVDPIVMLCKLWDGEPFDYWKVKDLPESSAQWWIANSSNASIVTSADACPGNAPVALCMPYDDGEKLLITDPWTANFHLGSDSGMRLAVDGSCEPAQPSPEPSTQEADPGAAPATESTKPATDSEPDTSPTKEPEKKPTDEPDDDTVVKPVGDVDSSGGGVVTTSAQTDAGPDAGEEELAMTGVESAHLAIAGIAMLVVGMAINATRRRLAPTEVPAHARH